LCTPHGLQAACDGDAAVAALGRELQLGVKEWSQILDAIGGGQWQTSIKTVILSSQFSNAFETIMGIHQPRRSLPVL
jgi:hypothetical protein